MSPRLAVPYRNGPRAQPRKPDQGGVILRLDRQLRENPAMADLRDMSCQRSAGCLGVRVNSVAVEDVDPPCSSGDQQVIGVRFGSPLSKFSLLDLTIRSRFQTRQDRRLAGGN